MTAASLQYSPGTKALLNRLSSFAGEMATLEQRTLLKISDQYRERILPAAAAAKGVHVGKALSGIPSGRAILTSRHTPTAGTDPITVEHKHIGPWQLVDARTGPHLIVSKKLGGTRRRRTDLANGLFVRAAGNRITATRRGSLGAVRTPQGLRAYARHPGTRGKGILAAARAVLDQEFTDLMLLANRRALRDTFRG